MSGAYLIAEAIGTLLTQSERDAFVDWINLHGITPSTVAAVTVDEGSTTMHLYLSRKGVRYIDPATGRPATTPRTMVPPRPCPLSWLRLDFLDRWGQASQKDRKRMRMLPPEADPMAVEP